MSASQHDPSQASSEDNLDDGLGGELTQDEIDDLAHRETFSNNFGSQLLPVPAGASKAVVVSWLNKQVPTNEFGLPTFFYRSDYLPGHESLTQNDADAAVVVLNYDEGYPTFDNGKIFWNQLPHETFGDYLTFQRYLDQAEELGLRQLQILSMDQNISLERITEMHAEYMWSLRARAFDLFQVAADRKRRELRVRSTEDKHFKIASGLIDRLKDVFEKEDFFANLDAKGAIEILRMLANLQRISMGLSQNGNMGNQPIDPMAGASGNDLMRQITKGTTPTLWGLMRILQP